MIFTPPAGLRNTDSSNEASLRLNRQQVKIHILDVVVAFIGVIIGAGIVYYAYVIEAKQLKQIDVQQAERLKKIDVQINCNQRFADLSNVRLEIEKMRQDKKLASLMTRAIGEYYGQFWALQEDQFYYYIQDFLPESMYIDWVYERISEFDHDKDVGGVSFTDGWETYGKSSSYGESISNSAPSFSAFVEFLRQHKKDNHDDKLKKIVTDTLHKYRAQFRNLSNKDQ